jgi:hypothetical protein
MRATLTLVASAGVAILPMATVAGVSLATEPQDQEEIDRLLDGISEDRGVKPPEQEAPKETPPEVKPSDNGKQAAPIPFLGDTPVFSDDPMVIGNDPVFDSNPFAPAEEQGAPAKGPAESPAPAEGSQPLPAKVAREPVTSIEGGPLPEEAPEPLPPPGLAFLAGAGVVGFTQATANAHVDPGVSYRAGVLFGVQRYIALELAYSGSVQALQADGLDGNPRLLSHGVEGLGRFQFVLGRLQPYALVGVGWRTYRVTNARSNDSVIANSDSGVEFPFGVGASWRYHGFVLDGRAVVRPATLNGLIGESERPRLHTWGFGLAAGFEL